MADIAIIRSMGGLVFDAVFTEKHESDLEITENPVETGVVVADHAYMKPLRATIIAGVSDTVLREIEGDRFSQGILRSRLASNLPQALLARLARGSSRSRQAFRMLQELQARAEPFDVQTGLRLYTNMVCTSLRTEQDKDNASVLVFTAELREVIVTYTETVSYPPRKDKKTKQQAGKKKEKGEQQGKEVTKEEQPAKRQSIAKSLTKALGG